MSKHKNNLLASIYDLESFNHTLGICSITGIAVEMKIPKLEGLEVMDYKSPFSFPKTAQKFAALESKELDKLDTEILAGIFLAIMHHKKLLAKTDQTTSIEKSVILRNSLTDYALIDLLKKASRLPLNNESLYPLLDFEAFLPVNTDIDNSARSIQANIVNHVQGCLSMAFPTKEFTPSESDCMDKILAAMPKSKAPNITELTNKARPWIKALDAHNIVKPSTIKKLKLILTDSNILSTGSANRVKVITFLDSLDLLAASKISEAFKIVEKHESLLTQGSEELSLTLSQEIKQNEEIKSAILTGTKALTASEKLAAILAKNKEKHEKKGTNDE